MEKKYKLTSNTKSFLGKKLFQIEALISFGNVSAGDLGGFIEKEDNLSHEGSAWVSGSAWVYGNPWISGNARVSGDAWVSDNARVSGDAWVSNNARVSGDAWISGNARVYGNPWISGNARVSGDAQVVWFTKVGREMGTLTAFMDKDNKITVTRGCYIGTIEEFADKVKNVHGNTDIAKEYELLIEFIKLRFKAHSGTNHSPKLQ